MYLDQVWAKKKNSLKECAFFVNSALKIQCYVVNNTLLQTAFSAILPTGILVTIFLIFLHVNKSGNQTIRIHCSNELFIYLY